MPMGFRLKQWRLIGVRVPVVRFRSKPELGPPESQTFLGTLLQVAFQLYFTLEKHMRAITSLVALLLAMTLVSTASAVDCTVKELYPLPGDVIWEGTDVINEAVFEFRVDQGEAATTFKYHMWVEVGVIERTTIYHSGVGTITVNPAQTTGITLKWTMNDADIGEYTVHAVCWEVAQGQRAIDSDSNGYSVTEVEEPY